MLFTSIEFLFVFLPLALAGYFILPFRFGLKNLWLLAASLTFYAWGGAGHCPADAEHVNADDRKVH